MNSDGIVLTPDAYFDMDCIDQLILCTKTAMPESPNPLNQMGAGWPVVLVVHYYRDIGSSGLDDMASEPIVDNEGGSQLWI